MTEDESEMKEYDYRTEEVSDKKKEDSRRRRCPYRGSDDYVTEDDIEMEEDDEKIEKDDEMVTEEDDRR